MTRHQYLIAQSSKIVANIVCLLVVLALGTHFGIRAVALGFVTGELAYLGFVLLETRRRGFSFWPPLRLFDKRIRRVFALTLYPMTGHMVRSSSVLVENYLASFLGTGILSALRYASRLVQASAGILLGGFEITSLPLAAGSVAGRRMDEMKENMRSSLQLLSVSSIMVILWFSFTSESFLAVFFQRGRFSEKDVILVSLLITLLVPSVFFGRVSAVLQTGFFAKLQFRPTLFIQLTSYAINIALLFALLGSFGIYCFPVSRTIATFLSAILAGILFHHRFGSIGWKQLFIFETKLLGAGVMASAAFQAGCFLGQRVPEIGFTHRLAEFLLGSSMGVGCFLMICSLLGLIDAGLIMRMVTNKLGLRRLLRRGQAE